MNPLETMQALCEDANLKAKFNGNRLELKYGFYLTINGTESVCGIVEFGKDMMQFASPHPENAVDYVAKEIQRIDKEEAEEEEDEEYDRDDRDWDMQNMGHYEAYGPDLVYPEY